MIGRGRRGAIISPAGEPIRNAAREGYGRRARSAERDDRCFGRSRTGKAQASFKLAALSLPLRLSFSMS